MCFVAAMKPGINLVKPQSWSSLSSCHQSAWSRISVRGKQWVIYRWITQKKSMCAITWRWDPQTAEKHGNFLWISKCIYSHIFEKVLCIFVCSLFYFAVSWTLVYNKILIDRFSRENVSRIHLRLGNIDSFGSTKYTVSHWSQSVSVICYTGPESPIYFRGFSTGLLMQVTYSFSKDFMLANGLFLSFFELKTKLINFRLDFSLLLHVLYLHTWWHSSTS